MSMIFVPIGEGMDTFTTDTLLLRCLIMAETQAFYYIGV